MVRLSFLGIWRSHAVRFFAYFLLWEVISGGVLTSCTHVNSQTEEIHQSDILANTELIPVKVKVTEAQEGAFATKVMTNGKVNAFRKVELRIRTQGHVEHLSVREGQMVNEGDLLLQLDQKDKQIELQHRRFLLEEAEVNKADLLIANGGKAYVDSSVSVEKLKLINTTSGYNKAVHAIESAEHELEKTRLPAPFRGLIADMQVKKNEYLDAGQVVCTLIDPTSFEVVFTLLEQEAIKVAVGQTVEVSPSGKDHRRLRAAVTVINPVVDEQGLVTVYARLKDNVFKIFEGMNVQVLLHQQTSHQLMVPKEAVVLRSGRPVVFTYSRGDQSVLWNYVETGPENDRMVAVTKGLDKGSFVVYDGNIHLDHHSKVEIVND